MKALLVLLLLTLISCSSAKRAARKLTESGMHEAALEKWAEAYKEDPEDGETLIGFKECQERVSNDRLVRIRDLRNAHEEELALKEFQDLIDLQNLHGIRLDYNSSTFQGREVALLWKYQKAQIEAFLRSQRPLAAEHRYQKYHAIFQSHHGMEELKNNINLTGATHCRALRKEAAATPFFMQFVNQYCRYFSPGKKYAMKKITIKDYLFSDPVVEVKVKGVDPEVTERIGHSLQKAFRDTPWFHPNGKKTPTLQLSGSYKWRRQVWKVTRAHSYTVEIPYTDYEDVRREKEVRTADGKTTTESYYESVPVTRYRTEGRVYEYPADKKTLDLEVILGGRVKLEGAPIPFSFSKEETITRYVHHVNLPHIGLLPDKEDLPTPGEKADDYAYRSGNELIGELNELWRARFCKTPSTPTLSASGENVMRCRRVKEFNQHFVNNWFTNQIGINFEETEKLIGKF